jgi:hypothetical protein
MFDPSLKWSERGVCRVLRQHRSTQRRIPTGRDDEERLTANVARPPIWPLRLSEAGYGNRREDSLHRAGQPTGEWLYRVIQRRLRG